MTSLAFSNIIMGMILFIIFTQDDLPLFRNRDPEVLERVFKEYHERVFTYLVIKAKGNVQLAEELFSDTFHSFILSAHHIRDTNTIYSWLIKIAHCRFIDFLRKYYREKKYTTDSEMHDNLPADDRVPDALEEKEKRLMIQQAMENLKPIYRKVLTLKHIENKSQKEMALILAKSESSVESLLFRSREALKKELEKLARVYA